MDNGEFDRCKDSAYQQDATNLPLACLLAAHGRSHPWRGAATDPLLCLVLSGAGIYRTERLHVVPSMNLPDGRGAS